MTESVSGCKFTTIFLSGEACRAFFNPNRSSDSACIPFCRQTDRFPVLPESCRSARVRSIYEGIYSRRHAPYPSCPVWLFLTPYAYVPCMTYFTQKRENVKIKSRRSAFPMEEEILVSEKRKITCFCNVLHDRLLRAPWMSEPSFRRCGRAFLALQESLFRIAESAV